MKSRVEALRGLMSENKMEAFVLFVYEGYNSPNCRYISGFTGTSAALVIDREKAVIISDGRYEAQAKQQSEFEFKLLTRGLPIEKEAMQLVEGGGYKSVGFEAEKVSQASYAKNFVTVGGIKWLDASAFIPKLRRKKDDGEVAALTKAAEITFNAYEETLKKVRVGMTELEFESLLAYNIKQMGGEGGWSLGNFIVASGKRSALPHGKASSKKFEAGDIVTVDFGVTVDGYMSDITRNFSLGSPSQKAIEICDLLIKAHHTAVAELAPGKVGKEMDAVARKVLADAGYVKEFSHNLGHGLGLEVHEDPRLTVPSNDVLEVGDVVAVEPGIYIDGWGGLRVEDYYLITERGARCLSRDNDQGIRVVEI